MMAATNAIAAELSNDRNRSLSIALMAAFIPLVVAALGPIVAGLLLAAGSTIGRVAMLMAIGSVAAALTMLPKRR